MLITFSLFIYPALQVQVQLASILLYIAYTQYALQYDGAVTRKTEFFNENIFLLSTYHMTLFASPWVLKHRLAAGWSIIVLIIGMIVVNYTIILGISFVACKRKLKISKMKKQWTNIKREHD